MLDPILFCDLFPKNVKKKRDFDDFCLLVISNSDTNFLVLLSKNTQPLFSLEIREMMLVLFVVEQAGRSILFEMHIYRRR